MENRLLLKSYAQDSKGLKDLDEFFFFFPSAHAEPSVASFFRCAPIRGSMVNLLIYLADQLTRGFQSADDQFQALQTQATEGFQSMVPSFKS
jgi:hypothetical protein